MTLDYNEAVRRRDGTLTNLEGFAKENGGEAQISALADDVATNTSAIRSITAQLSALVSDVGTNTSAIGSITSQLSALVDDVGRNTSAINTINSKLISVASVVFTSAGYGLWAASTKTTHRILQAVAPNYFISGDGSDYCGLIKRSSTSVEPAPAADSPITMDCLVIAV